jgi:hypothetical protein
MNTLYEDTCAFLRVSRVELAKYITERKMFNLTLWRKAKCILYIQPNYPQVLYFVIPVNYTEDAL